MGLVLRHLIVGVALLLAGCAQPPSPVVPLGSLVVEVRDMELALVPAANVSLPDLGRFLMTDEHGLARFVDLPPGRHNVSASKSSLMNAFAFVDVEEGDEASVSLRLNEPPPVFVRQTWQYVGDGTCAASSSPLAGDVDLCPARRIPQSVGSQPDGDPLPRWIESLQVTINWTAGDVEKFRIQLFVGSERSARPWADGTYNRTLEGVSPLRFDFPREQVWGPILRGGALELRLTPVDATAEFEQHYSIVASAPYSLYLDEDHEATWNETKILDSKLRPGDGRTFMLNETDEYLWAQFVVTGDCYAGRREPVTAVLTAPDGAERRVSLVEGSSPYVSACSPPPQWGPTPVVYLIRRVGTWELAVESGCTCTVVAKVSAARLVPPAS